MVLVQDEQVAGVGDGAQKLVILKGPDRSRSLAKNLLYGRETWSHMVDHFLSSPTSSPLKENGLIDC